MTFVLRRTPEELDRLAAFGRFVRRARQCAGLSQQRLADLSGVSQSVISRLERARAPRLGLERVLAMQAVLGGCLPLGICPHDHQCIWQPRLDSDKPFQRRPGIATERVQEYARFFARAELVAEPADEPAIEPTNPLSDDSLEELDASDDAANEPVPQLPATRFVDLVALGD